MARILLTGYMVRLPLAGNVLAYAQYLRGFEMLGHDVLYLETAGWPSACYDPATELYSDDPRPCLHAVRQLLRAVGAEATVVFIDQAEVSHGMPWPQVKQAIADADVLINVGGICWLPEFERCSRRALIDMDPLFTQVGRFGGEGLDRYRVHFTYGTNVGQAGCGVPTRGIDWKPIVPPVIPELWQHYHTADHTPPRPLHFTTIANWSAYGAVEHANETYGQKDMSFAELIDLPARVDARLEVAASGMPDDQVARFEQNGWRIGSGAEVSRDWPAYRRFISASDGELSAAKHGYVKSRCGWISDRTVCYLAAGRPAIVQDTAVPPNVIGGADGFVTFSTIEDAARAIHNVTADYQRHSRAAARLADSVFSYRITLPRLLEQALGSTAAASPSTRP